MGRRRRSGERTRKSGPRTRFQVVSSECLSERARDNPGPVPLPLVEGCEEPRSGCSQVASQGRAREPHSRASTRMTAKFFTKKRRSGSTSEPSSKDTKQTVPWPRDSTPVTTASGARRRQRSSITPSCYTLREKGNARIADDAQPKRTR